MFAAAPAWCRRALVATAVLVTLVGCSSAPVRNPLAQWHGSPNYDARRPQLIVLHQTQMDSAESALETLRTRNAGGRVSAHYLIGRDGRLYQLVSEQDRAWHAGAGSWGGIVDINSSSIGIELDNNGSEPFTPIQIGTLLRLLGDVTGRLGIPSHLVIAHGDVAPTRKRDPGVLFPWRHLAEAGFGLWPRDQLEPAPPDFDGWAALRLIGYDLRDPAAALQAFHRHFRASESAVWMQGDADILWDLHRQLTQPAALEPTDTQHDTLLPAPPPAALQQHEASQSLLRGD
ncbi:MAG: N-acetylmuramoyl-L-alanine amidase [Pseudomonadota bacterium]|nr:N-acetylmuramoyl-L-alanine amidase [Pseudomonadota bacterium]